MAAQQKVCEGERKINLSAKSAHLHVSRLLWSRAIKWWLSCCWITCKKKQKKKPRCTLTSSTAARGRVFLHSVKAVVCSQFSKGGHDSSTTTEASQCNITLKTSHFQLLEPPLQVAKTRLHLFGEQIVSVCLGTAACLLSKSDVTAAQQNLPALK